MCLGLSAWDLLERLAVVLRRLLYQVGCRFRRPRYYKLKKQKKDHPAWRTWLEFVVISG
jgi:hypothetical protein